MESQVELLGSGDHRHPDCKDPHCGRRSRCALLEEGALEALAEQAADKAIEKMKLDAYQGVGRTVVNWAKYVFFSGVVALAFWLNSKGWLKWP